MTDAFISGVPELKAAFDVLIASVDVANGRGAAAGAKAIQTGVRAHMNGRPGPRSITGTLRDSVDVEAVRRLGLGAAEVRVGPTAPYGRRIELGFRGTDSAGRHYDQGPFPYLAPGLEDALPAVDAVTTAAWAAALKVG